MDKIEIKTGDEAPGRAKARRRSRGRGPVVASVIAAVVLAAGWCVVFFRLSGTAAPGGAEPERAVRKVDGAAAPGRTGRLSDQSEGGAGAGDGAEAREVVVDDPAGQLLWASPTAGPAISLQYVPAGAQCLVHLRPAALAAHPEGEKVLAALGPWGQRAASELQELMACELSELDSVLMAIVARPDGRLDVSFRALLHEPWRGAELATRFPSGREDRRSGEDFLVVGERAYYQPMPALAKAEQIDRIVISTPVELIDELIASGGEEPPLVRDLESLVAHTDSDRLATIIIPPKFLEAGGVELLTDDAAPVRDAVEWLVGDDATAIALSLNWDEHFFLELRAAPALNVQPRRLAAKLAERIGAAPDLIEERILAAPWHPYGRKVLARLPAMLRKLALYTRRGEEDRQAVLRAYLPAVGGHNLLMGAELLLTQSQGVEEAGTAAPDVEATSPKGRTIAERLSTRTSLAFSKDSLERALELLADDLGIEIEMVGSDLQLDGITKNQQLALNLRDRPAQEILLEILLKANPDRTAVGPADPRQKLVYVVEEAAGDAAGRIIVTTRTAAEKHGQRLPDVFLGRER